MPYNQGGIKRSTEEDKERILDLYTAGVPITEIAVQVGLNKKTIFYWLRKFGVKPDVKDTVNARKRLTPEQIEEIIKLYKEGMAVADIRDTTGATIDTIYRHTRKLGLSRSLDGAPHSKAIKMYLEEGYTVDQVLEATGIARATFFRRLKTYKERRGL